MSCKICVFLVLFLVCSICLNLFFCVHSFFQQYFTLHTTHRHNVNNGRHCFRFRCTNSEQQHQQSDIPALYSSAYSQRYQWGWNGPFGGSLLAYSLWTPVLRCYTATTSGDILQLPALCLDFVNQHVLFLYWHLCVTLSHTWKIVQNNTNNR